MQRVLPLGLAIALALPLFSASRPASAATPPTSFTVSDASFLTLAYGTNGKVTESTDKEAALKTAIKGNTGIIDIANNQAALGTLSGTPPNQTLNRSVPQMIAIAADNTNSSWLLDGLGVNSANKTFLNVHLFVAKDSSNPKTGFANGHFLEQAADGTFFSTDVLLTLAFP